MNETAEEQRGLVVAIDGPSGAGKGTVARAVAARLGYRHVDTGAMYRAIAWLANARGVPLEDEQAVAGVAHTARLDLSSDRVLADAQDVTRAIRTPDMDRAATVVARMPAVRRVLVERQRALGGAGAIVMEGRDIGTVVFPDADVKVYLDADPAERARRRAADPAHTAANSSALGDVAVAMADRDRLDRTRPVSPLAVAPDAVRIDTTGVTIEAVVEQVLALVAAAARRSRRAVNGA